MIKAYVCRAAEWVSAKPCRSTAGMGYAEEFPVSRLFRGRRVLSIFEGADETLGAQSDRPHASSIGCMPRGLTVPWLRRGQHCASCQPARPGRTRVTATSRRRLVDHLVAEHDGALPIPLRGGSRDRLSSTSDALSNCSWVGEKTSLRIVTWSGCGAPTSRRSRGSGYDWRTRVACQGSRPRQSAARVLAPREDARLRRQVGVDPGPGGHLERAVSRPPRSSSTAPTTSWRRTESSDRGRAQGLGDVR